MFNATKDEICIAAYLHDIGKFAQRAEIKKYCSDYIKGQILPQYKGIYTHYHSLFTYGFIEYYLSKFPSGVDAEKILRLASYHHSSHSIEDYIISVADRLSSGSDRTKIMEDLDIDNQGKGRERYKTTPLIHIPSEVSDDDNVSTKQSFVSLKPLEKDALVNTGNSAVGPAEYKLLWDQFEKDFVETCTKNKNDTQSFILALDSLLERYT